MHIRKYRYQKIVWLLKRLPHKCENLSLEPMHYPGLAPVLSNQKINAYLKEIADLCGIKKRLSYHLARHTFATMLLSKGVPIESVSKMLGHTNIKTTQIYARITNKKIEQDMMQVADKFDGFKNCFIN